MDLSFIIPALNEEAHIGGVLDSIQQAIDGRFIFEVIVVDNGSTDRTVRIASEKGAIVLNAPLKSIASMRNIGAIEATSDVLVFLDADVYVMKDWAERMRTVMEHLRRHPNFITGSLYGISEDNNWIERVWFAPRTTRVETNYINSGHLILHSTLFRKIGGFNAQLETGEDYEFCARAKEMGVRIENDPKLKVVHAGYPKTLKTFFTRERWHARGDFTSIKSMAGSKPALVCLACLVVASFGIVGVFFFPKYWCAFSISYIFFFASLSLASAIFRCRGVFTSTLDLIRIFFLYVVYFSARTISLVDMLIERYLKRRAFTRRKT